MKNKLFIIVTAAAVLLAGNRSQAAETNTAAAELKDLVGQINASLQAGKKTEAEQADHLKAFDELIAKHKGETNEDVARILFMKASLYTQVFHNDEKGLEVMQQIQRDFPGSAAARSAAGTLVNLSLKVGAKFPDFDEKDAAGQALSVANYKGKVVMVDFWATWCGPCVGEVPNVVAAYKKYHDKGFEIIGVSLDRAGDLDKMKAFTKEKEMPWPQYYDGGYWTNKLAVKYGINSIPATFLLDGSGTIIAKNARGENLEPAIVKALGAH